MLLYEEPLAFLIGFLAVYWTICLIVLIWEAIYEAFF